LNEQRHSLSTIDSHIVGTRPRCLNQRNSPASYFASLLQGMMLI